MMENIEKGLNFVDPPEKAEAMAYVEERQREKDERRKRAGLSVDLEERDKVAEREGESWENRQSIPNKHIEENVDILDGFCEGRRESGFFSVFEIDGSYSEEEMEEIINTTTKKIKAYLGEDSSSISVTFHHNFQGFPRFYLERKKSQEE
jgi:hypothetical protein